MTEIGSQLCLGTVNADGRVIFTRWEYNSRTALYLHPLIVMNPDGTGQTEWYGNNSDFPSSIIHANSIPGSRKLLAIVSGHHTPYKGKLALIDRQEGTQAGAGIEFVADAEAGASPRGARYRKQDPVRAAELQYDGLHPLQRPHEHELQPRPEHPGVHERELHGPVWRSAAPVTAGTLVLNGTLDDTSLQVADDAGVEQAVQYLYLAGSDQPRPSGTYGSSQSAVANKDDTRFSGTGVLVVRRGGGFLLVVR